ncbi:MAG: LCP family protein [Candidatus Muiribacteriaceae bacterium]
MKKGKALPVFLFIVALASVAAIYYHYFSAGNDDGLVSVRTKDLGKMIFLLMGVDNDPRGRSRSDTMMLAFVNTYTKKIQLLSVPRDTKIFIEGRGDRKINAAFVYDGIEGTEKAIEELLDIEIDNFVKVDINGFINIIDILGGVDINVEEDMHYIDKAGELYINIKKGRQHMDGRTAMYYVRYRDKVYADIGRIKRQQKFIKEMLSKMKSVGIVWKLPDIIQEIYRNIETDMGIKQILSLIRRFRDFDLSEVKVDTLPGDAKYIDKVSYYVHDDEETRRLIEEIMRYEADKGIDPAKDMNVKESTHEVSDTHEITEE